MDRLESERLFHDRHRNGLGGLATTPTTSWLMTTPTLTTRHGFGLPSGNWAA